MKRGLVIVAAAITIGWAFWALPEGATPTANPAETVHSSPAPSLSASTTAPFSGAQPSHSPAPLTAPSASPALATTADSETLTLADIPPGRFQQQLARLPAPARTRALQKLKALEIPLNNAPSLNADSNGDLFYACLAPTVPDEVAQAPLSASALTSAPTPISPAPSTAPAKSLNGATPSATATAAKPATANSDTPDSPEPRPASSAETGNAAVPVSAPPLFHSKPGSANVIYLDFNGHVITGTQWNTDRGIPAWTALAYSTDADLTTFSDSEQADIEEIWRRVAEAYRGFDVDVTTEDPGTFTNKMARALITSKDDLNDIALPSSATSSGVAYIDTFGTATFASKTSPTFVYHDKLNTPESIALAVSHEVGHNMGLSHDGTSGSEYYTGHGTGDTSWGPIMGSAYTRNVTQWTKGEYFNANNLQDDLSKISGKLGYRTDDSPSALETATDVTLDALAFSGTGIIEKNADADYFRVVPTMPSLNLRVSPFRNPLGTHGTTLDVTVDLLDSNGDVIASSNPGDTTNADLLSAVTPGETYYLKISATGAGLPTANPPSGYTAYGSLGSYSIQGVFGIALPLRQTPVIGQPFNLTVTPGGAAPFTYVWSRNGKTLVGESAATLNFPTLAVSDGGFYRVRVTDNDGVQTDAFSHVLPRYAKTELKGWGNFLLPPSNTPEAVSIPETLSIPLAATGGYAHALALNANGTVAAWGNNTYQQTAVPAELNDVVAIAAGSYHSLALKSAGRVIAWGGNWLGQSTVPGDLQNVIAVAAGFDHSLALKAGGTVVAWGGNTYGQSSVPEDLEDVIAIAAGESHSLALKADGTVVAWGRNTDGQTTIPGGILSIAEVAASSNASAVRREDGTVTYWGSSFLNPPGGLLDVIALRAGGYHGIALKADGTVTMWGNNDHGQTTPPVGLANVLSVGAGLYFSFAVQNNTTDQTPEITTPPQSTSAEVGGSASFSVEASGEGTLSYQWQKNNADLTGETNETLVIDPVATLSGGSYRVIVTNDFGSTPSAAATLTVLGADVTAPVVTLSAKPKNGTKTTSANLLFTVSVKEARNLDALEYQINGSGTWLPLLFAQNLGSPSLYSWNGDIPLIPGPNVLTFRATDAAGNSSKLVNRTVHYLVPSPLALPAPLSTDGAITKGFANSQRNLGYTYSVTATPAKGKIFKEWLITVDGDTTSSRARKLTFTMQEGMEITPVFIDNFFIPAAGNYLGLFGTGDIVPADSLTQLNRRNGLSQFALNSKGGFSGSLVIGGKTVRFRGQFDGFGEAQLTVKYDNLRFISLAPLTLTEATGTEPAQISATTSFDANPLSLRAYRAQPYTGKALSIFPGAGRINVALTVNDPPPSMGHGFASVLIRANGTAVAAGRLPDGMAFTASSRLIEISSTAPYWTFAFTTPLAPKSAGLLTGLLYGDLLIHKAPVGTDPDLTTTLSWLRAPNLLSPYFPAGRVQTLAGTGARWTFDPAVNLLTGLPAPSSQAFTLSLDPDAAVLTVGLAQAGVWPANHKPTLTTPPPKLSFKFAAGTGAFTGSVLRPVSLTKTAATVYRGILLNPPIEEGGEILHGYGHIFSGSASGRVEVKTDP